MGWGGVEEGRSDLSETLGGANRRHLCGSVQSGFVNGFCFASFFLFLFFTFFFMLLFSQQILAALLTCLYLFRYPEPMKQWSVKQEIASQSESAGAVGFRHICDNQV